LLNADACATASRLEKFAIENLQATDSSGEYCLLVRYCGKFFLKKIELRQFPCVKGLLSLI
jgi:hypothetical protein